MATIVRRNPKRALTIVEPVIHPGNLLNEVEMLASDFWDRWGEPLTYGTSLPMDLYEYKDEMVVKAELPGFEKGDVDVSLEGDLLTIKAEKKQKAVEEDATYYLCERGFGRYSRSLTLPFPVDTNKVHTTLENGILEIRLPKAEEAKAKHIQIKVGSSSKAITSRSK